MQDDILGLSPAAESTMQKNPYNPGHGKEIWFPGHGQRNGKPSRADGKAAHPPCIGCMTV